jgi:hypothetical protein
VTAAPATRRRWNPDLQRHCWDKYAEHRRRCAWCRIDVENRQIGDSPRWYQAWAWPDRPDLAAGDNRRGGKVPVCAGPDGDPAAVAQLGPASPAGNPPVDHPGPAGADGESSGDAGEGWPETAAPPPPPASCPNCAEPLLAMTRAVDGFPVGILAADPAGDWLAVRQGSEWRVRKLTHADRLAGDQIDARFRRRVHLCSYRYPCMGDAGQCARMGRLYPGGTFCDECNEYRFRPRDLPGIRPGG